MLYKKDEESRRASYIFLFLLPFAIVPVLLNIWASSNSIHFGMTTPELMKEVYMIVFYFIAGFFIAATIGRVVKRKNATAAFGVRVLVIISVVALTYNQLAISLALAPVKVEFKQVASTCKARTGELICGDALKNVLKKRDQTLEKMNAIRIGDWRITAVDKHTITTDRDSVYIYSPF